MAYSQEWLEDQNAVILILVEAYVNILGVDTPIYLSNRPYVTTSASISFLPVLNNSISFSEKISLDSSISMSFGDIEVTNYNGEFDIWLKEEYIWVNRPIKVFVGDPSWSTNSIEDINNDFLTVFTGIIADIDSKDRDSINIRVRDKLERLNTPISENILGDTYYNGVGTGQSTQSNIRPIIFGEVHNIIPLMYDPSLLKYIINDGDMELLIELRDNAAPLYTHNGTIVTLPFGASTDLSTGTFTLSQKLFGTLTASAQGVKKSINWSTHTIENTYVNTIVDIITIIAMEYGKSYSRLLTTDIDWENLSAFNNVNPIPIGIYISSKTNALEVCQSIASSVGAQVYMNRLGKLQLLRLGDYTTGVINEINDDDILHHSLHISEKTEVLAAIKIGYCKNWTVQTGLTTGIPDKHKELFSEEDSITTENDTIVSDIYKLNIEPDEIPTLLITKIDAINESIRRLNMFKYPRIVYSFTGTSKLLSLVLGQQVTLYHNRFNLSEGKQGQVIGLTPKWSDSTIEVEVLI